MFFRKRLWLAVICVIYAAGMIAISVPKTKDLTEDSDYYAWWQAGNDFGARHVLDYQELIRPYTHPPFAAFVYRMTLSQLQLKTSALVFFS